MKFEIAKVYEPKRSSNDKLYLNCETKNSILISFWGLKHVREVQQQTVPFRVTCKVKETSIEVISKINVRFWVRENQDLKFSPIKKK